MDRVLVQDSRRVRVQPWASHSLHPLRKVGSQFSMMSLSDNRAYTNNQAPVMSGEQSCRKRGAVSLPYCPNAHGNRAGVAGAE